MSNIERYEKLFEIGIKPIRNGDAKIIKSYLVTREGDLLRIYQRVTKP